MEYTDAQRAAIGTLDRRMAVEHGRQAISTDQVVVRNRWAQALPGLWPAQ
jgi:hypothetical protein